MSEHSLWVGFQTSLAFDDSEKNQERFYSFPSWNWTKNKGIFLRFSFTVEQNGVRDWVSAIFSLIKKINWLTDNISRGFTV